MAGLLVFSSFFVVAKDEQIIIEDPEDDVIDGFAYDEDFDDIIYTDTKPNIDIVKIEYIQNGREVTINLEVKNKIEDKGDLDVDLEETELSEFILYGVTLETTNDGVYNIEYINNECELNGERRGFSWEKIGNSILSFTFDLESSDEEYYASSGLTVDFSLSGWYFDEFYHESDAPIIDAGGPYQAEVGENVSFEAEVLGGTPPYEYIWDFNDGESSSELNPTHSFDSAGKYTVTFTVIDANDTSVSDIAQVIISGLNNGNNNNNGGESSLFIFVGLIAVVVIIGVIVVIVVIKR